MLICSIEEDFWMIRHELEFLHGRKINGYFHRISLQTPVHVGDLQPGSNALFHSSQKFRRWSNTKGDTLQTKYLKMCHKFREKILVYWKNMDTFIEKMLLQEFIVRARSPSWLLWPYMSFGQWTSPNFGQICFLRTHFCYFITDYMLLFKRGKLISMTNWRLVVW